MCSCVDLVNFNCFEPFRTSHFSVLTAPSLSRFTMPLSRESRLSSRMSDRSRSLPLCPPQLHCLSKKRRHPLYNNQWISSWLLGREEKVSLQFHCFLLDFVCSASAQLHQSTSQHCTPRVMSVSGQFHSVFAPISVQQVLLLCLLRNNFHF